MRPADERVGALTVSPPTPVKTDRGELSSRDYDHFAAVAWGMNAKNHLCELLHTANAAPTPISALGRKWGGADAQAQLICRCCRLNPSRHWHWCLGCVEVGGGWTSIARLPFRLHLLCRCSS